MGEFVLVPSVVPHGWQEECIVELCFELTQHMARAGLQGGSGLARSTSGSWRHSCSQAWSPSAKPQECKWPNIQEKTLWLNNQVQGGYIPIPGIGTSHKDAEVPHPNIQLGTILPLPVPHNHIPLTSGLATPWVTFTCIPSHGNSKAGCGEMAHPHTHTHTKGCPPLPQELMDECPTEDPVKKQVRFHKDEDLGVDPTLPMDLTIFLEGETAEEQDNAQSPSIPLTVDPPQLPCHDGHLCCPTHIGGAHPKAPVKPSAAAQSQSKYQLKGMPDPVDQSNQWSKAEMDRVGYHPCWWKEIRTLKRYTLESALKKYTIERDLSEPEALYFSWWQAVAFRLPLPNRRHWVGGIFHPVFMGCILGISCPMLMLPEWETSRQLGRKKTLALARALQCCTERLGAPTRVLCNAAQELQRCMAPLMCLNWDEIVEAPLLEPMGDEPGTSPTLEEEATLLGEEQGLPEAPETTASLWECLKTPKPKEPTEHIDTLSTSVFSKPCQDPFQKIKRSQGRIEPKSLPNPDLDIISDWVQAYLKKSGEIPDWWWDFWSICCQGVEPLNDTKV